MPTADRWGVAVASVFGRASYFNYRTTTSYSTHMRSDCYNSVLVSYGRAYFIPWACECNYPLGNVSRTVCDYEKRIETESSSSRLVSGTPGAVSPLVCDDKDWPVDRANNSRSGSSPVSLPENPRLKWTLTSPAAIPVTSAVAVGMRVFVGGNDGAVRCVDLDKGTVLWTAWTGSRIHTAPTVWQCRVLVSSADGCVYAFAADDGRMLWRFRASPMERRIMFYGSLASTWPVMGGVMVHDNIAYAASGILGNDGTYVYALDPVTGAAKWSRETGRIKVDRQDLSLSAAGGWTVAAGFPRMASGTDFSPATFDPKDGRLIALTGQGSDGALPSRSYTKGAHVGVFHDRHILYGGKFLISEDWYGGYYGRYQIITLNDKGEPQAADSALASLTTAWPVWNNSVFATAAQKAIRSKYEFTPQILECFDSEKLDAYLSSRVTKATEFKKYSLHGGESELPYTDPNLRAPGMVKWKTEHPSILAMALAANAMVIVEQKVDTVTEQAAGWSLKYIDNNDGKVRAEVPIPAGVTFDGLAIARDGTVLVSLLDGRVLAVR